MGYKRKMFEGKKNSNKVFHRFSTGKPKGAVVFHKPLWKRCGKRAGFPQGQSFPQFVHRFFHRFSTGNGGMLISNYAGQHSFPHFPHAII
jgi:hypothetical protein